MSKILLLAVALSISGLSFSQDVQKKIDEAAKDKKTRENAAKADVFIAKKRNIFDSTTTSLKSETTIKKKSGTACKSKKKKKISKQ